MASELSHVTIARALLLDAIDHLHRADRDYAEGAAAMLDDIGRSLGRYDTRGRSPLTVGLRIPRVKAAEDVRRGDVLDLAPLHHGECTVAGVIRTNSVAGDPDPRVVLTFAHGERVTLAAGTAVTVIRNDDDEALRAAGWDLVDEHADTAERF